MQTIPWGWLSFNCLWYAVMGFLNSPYLLPGVFATTIAWPLAVVLAFHRDRVITREGYGGLSFIALLPVLLVASFTPFTTFVLSGALSGTWAIAGIFLISEAGYKLLNLHPRVHTFVVLAVTSWLGLGLGWLANSILIIIRTSI